MVCRGENSAQAKRSLESKGDIIGIPECDMSAMAERFKLTLIGRVLHLGGRSIEALISQLPRPRIWNVEGRVRGRNLGNGRFQFDFDNERDLQAVLNRRPCHFNQWSFALERWEPFTREDFPNTIPFWVQVTGVPVHFWNDGTYTEIAKALGTKWQLMQKVPAFKFLSILTSLSSSKAEWGSRMEILGRSLSYMWAFTDTASLVK